MNAVIKLTGKSVTEYDILILSPREESNEKDRRKQAEWLKEHTKRGKDSITVTLPVTVETIDWLWDIAEDFGSWGDPYGGWDRDKLFRIRTFNRVRRDIEAAISDYSKTARN